MRGRMLLAVLAVAAAGFAVPVLESHHPPRALPAVQPRQSSRILPAPVSPSFTVGVDVYVNHAYPQGATQRGKVTLGWIKDVLHVQNVQFDWGLESSGNRVLTGGDTPSPQTLSALTNIAHELDMTVSWRVMFTVSASPGHAGRLDPSSPAAWFASLYAAEQPYLKAAQEDGVAEFAAGTERTTIEGSPLWRQFFRQAAGVYRGPLTYASWGGRPGYGGITTGALSELPPVHEYAMTAYPSARLPANASQAQVTAAWKQFLAHVPSGMRARTALDEIGIAAAAGAYVHPWGFPGFTGAADDRVQAQWFTAVCQAARAYHMRGVWFFPVYLDDDPQAPYPGLAKFEGRAASESAIRSCV